MPEKNNVVYIDSTYIKYRRMWKDDRWKFSGDMVKLTIKESREGLTAEEQHTIRTMNRIVEENDGKWVDEEPQVKKRK